MRQSSKADAILKNGDKKKPLPSGHRATGHCPPMEGNTGGVATPKPKPFRTSSSASGNFKIKARFISAVGNSVELEKEDGTSISVELNKLSAADNQYVNNVGNNDLTRRKITAKPEIPFAKNRLKLAGGQWEFKHDSAEATDFSLPQDSIRMSQPIGFGASS